MYENQKLERQPKRRFGTVKKVAAAALVLYLGSSAAYYAAPAAMHYFNGMQAKHGHHGHHHGHGPHKFGHGRPDHFYIPNQQVRSDIAEDRAGVPLILDVFVLDSKSALPVENINVDLWHADAEGHFSGFEHRGPPAHHREHKEHREHDHEDGSIDEIAAEHSSRVHGYANHEEREKEEEEDKVDGSEEKHSRHEKTNKHKKDDKKSKDGKHEKDEKKSKHGKHEKHDKFGEDKHNKKPHHEPHGPHHPPHGPHGPPKHGKHGKHGKHNFTKDGVEDSEWLRGVQTTDEEGKVSFTTIFLDRINYKLHSPSAEKSLVRFDAKQTSELKNGKLIFNEELSTKVHELEAYSASKSWKLRKHSKCGCNKKNKVIPEMISDVEYVEEGNIESGLRAKVTILVDGSDYVQDEFTDSETE